MKRNKYKDYLWYTALAVFILCIIEGVMYYHDTENTFLKISLNIQNAIKAYKIDPDIKQSEAIRFFNESGGGIVRGIITYLYCASVIVAPFCTIGALTILILKPANYIRGLLTKKKVNKILVLGGGSYQSNFIDSLSGDCNLTVVENSGISDEKKSNYLRHGIKFIQKYSDMPMETVLKSLRLPHFEYFLLCDDNVMENIENLKLLMELTGKSGQASKSYQQVYICCDDCSMGELIRQYYDKPENKQLEINIVDVNQMAVNKMFLEHPVYLANDKDHRDVHMGIIGFGDFGQHTLLQALNMSVLSADSKICIDVFDKDMPNIIGTFMKHFSVDMLDHLKLASEDLYFGEQAKYYELTLSGNADNRLFSMDGTVTLRFWKADARTLRFSKLFRQCHAQMPFTYLVIAMGDTPSMANTIIELKQLLYKKGADMTAVPIGIRTKDKQNMIDIYRQNNLFEIARNKDIFSFASLTNRDIVDDAKLFNHRYNMLYDVISEYKQSGKVLDDKFMLRIEETLTQEQLRIERDRTRLDETWHSMKMFDRESSIAQALHQNVKKWLVLQQKAYSLEADKEELEQIEHRRWTLFMITQGFKYEKAERKDLNAKTHPCILDWERLKQEKPDTLEYDFTPYYILKVTEQNKGDK